MLLSRGLGFDWTPGQPLYTAPWTEPDYPKVGRDGRRIPVLVQDLFRAHWTPQGLPAIDRPVLQARDLAYYIATITADVGSFSEADCANWYLSGLWCPLRAYQWYQAHPQEQAADFAAAVNYFSAGGPSLRAEAPVGFRPADLATSAEVPRPTGTSSSHPPVSTPPPGGSTPRFADSGSGAGSPRAEPPRAEPSRTWLYLALAAGAALLLRSK